MKILIYGSKGWIEKKDMEEIWPDWSPELS